MAKVSTKWPKCSAELIFTYHFCHYDYNFKLPFKNMNGILYMCCWSEHMNGILEYKRNAIFSKNICVCLCPLKAVESQNLWFPLTHPTRKVCGRDTTGQALQSCHRPRASSSEAAIPDHLLALGWQTQQLWQLVIPAFTKPSNHLQEQIIAIHCVSKLHEVSPKPF